MFLFFFFFNDTATTEIYTLSLHDALPISRTSVTIPLASRRVWAYGSSRREIGRAHVLTQSRPHLVCRLLLEKKKKKKKVRPGEIKKKKIKRKKYKKSKSK